LGYPLPPRPRHFLAGLTVSFPAPSPNLLRNRVHPLVRFAPLQSSPIRTCPGLRLSAEPWSTRAACSRSAFHGVAFPLRDISLQRRYNGGPTSAALRPRRFARPRRFRPPPALRVCFTPLPRPGFHPSGISPPSTAEPIRHRLLPSRRLALVAYEWLPIRASFRGPALRALYRARSPLRLRRCYPTHRPLPSWAFSSSRFSLSKPSETPSCPLPPMTLRRFRESSPMAFSVLPV